MKLKELREAKGWTVDELARRADVAAHQIIELESESKTIVTTTHTLLKLARALGHSVTYIFC